MDVCTFPPQPSSLFSLGPRVSCHISPPRPLLFFCVLGGGRCAWLCVSVLLCGVSSHPSTLLLCLGRPCCGGGSGNSVWCVGSRSPPSLSSGFVLFFSFSLLQSPVVPQDPRMQQPQGPTLEPPQPPTPSAVLEVPTFLAPLPRRPRLLCSMPCPFSLSPLCMVCVPSCLSLSLCLSLHGVHPLRAFWVEFPDMARPIFVAFPPVCYAHTFSHSLTHSLTSTQSFPNF